MKNIINAFLLYSIFSLSAFILSGVEGGKGRGGVVFAQQLSSRYIRMQKQITFGNNPDTVVTFGSAVATKRAGQMVGIANGICAAGGPAASGYGQTTYTNYIPYIYRLDSTGKFTFLKAIKFPPNGISKLHIFGSITPYKDNLYITGTILDNDPSSTGDCHSTNEFVIKTDSAANVVWRNKIGYYGGCESIYKQLVCSDGGLLVSGNASIIEPNNVNNRVGYAAFLTKYNAADGSIKFNKAFRDPLASTGDPIADSTRGNLYFNAMVETPDKGFLLTGPYNTTSGTGGTAGPLLVRLDSNGNKLWEKMALYDPAVYRFKELETWDIIAHPAGGYVVVGYANIPFWDSTIAKNHNFMDVNGQKKYYSVHHSGGFMMKLNETGDVEWTKIFRIDAKTDLSDWGTLLTQEITLRDIELSYSNGSPVGFVLKGLSNGHHPSGFQGDQSLVIKTDLNGNLIWSRQYYTGGANHNANIAEEPGGSLLISSFATPEPDVFGLDVTPSDLGILRLNSVGLLGEALCSLSPKVSVYDDALPFAYDTNPAIFVTTPPLLGTLPPAGTFNKAKPNTSTGICVNPLSASFNYNTECFAYGATVKFENKSLGGSYFHYDFGDSFAQGNNSSDTAGTQHLYTHSGTYTVTLTVWDTDSTKTDSYAQAIAITNRHITILPGNTTVCAGTSINSSFTMNHGYFLGNYTYFVNKNGQWAGIEFATSTDSSFSTIPLVNSFNFYVNIQSNTYCTTSDTVEITVIPSVNMSVRGENTTLCIGDSALLIASGSNSYLWNPGSSSNDSLKVFLAGTYTVSSGKTKVCGTDSALIKVTVNPLPLVDAGADQTIFPGKQAPLLATGGTSYIWSPALGLSATNIANPIAEPEQNTTYFVKVADANGCVSSDSVTINLKFCGVDLFVPNAFSPNADNENDVFYVKTLNNNCIQTFELKIFDRWGNKVFESHDINAGWNGAYKGKAMDSGVFVYFLNALLEAGEIVTQKGNITLLR